MFNSIFDWIDRYVCAFRYQKMWTESLARWEARHEREVKAVSEPIKWAESCNERLREMVEKLEKQNEDLEERNKDLSYKIGLLRTLLNDYHDLDWFDQLKEKRVKKLKAMMPSNYYVGNKKDY